MTNKEKQFLDIIEDLYWQFGYHCGPDKQFIHSGCLSTLEDAEDILIKHGRLEKYRKNGKMDWYRKVEK